MINQIWRRLQLIVAQGVLKLAGQKTLQAMLLDGELIDNLIRVEPYGLSYMPKDGAEVYSFFVGGDRAIGLALIVGDKRYQMTLEPGEVAIHDDDKNYVHIMHGGVINVRAKTKVIADTPLFETTQDAKIGGNLIVVGSTASNGGYTGENGGEAQMTAGMDVIDGDLKHRGVSVGKDHDHDVLAVGSPTSGVRA